MKHTQLLLLIFFLLCLSSATVICGKTYPSGTKLHEKQIAFPGAEGAGMYTSGGRGGAVVAVTNLQDDGPGSLRKAIEQKGARTIVFRVSGTIALKSDLEIKSGDLTIAGQTAPGDGICIRNYPVHVKADNVIIRYIRVRLGDESGRPFDAINGKNQKNIMLDHCSFSWSVDETASFYDNENFTMQWCIISESMNHSVHPKGAHGYGGIWGGMNASFHHNILAHHKSRNPRLQGSRYHHMPEKEKAEFCNNVIYNWLSKSAYAGEEGNYNMIENYYKPGPATSSSHAAVILEPYKPLGKFYLKDNVDAGVDKVTENNWKGVEIDSEDLSKIKLDQPVVVSPHVQPEPAREAYQHVLEQAGASKVRDAVDQRIIEEIRDGTSHFGDHGIIDSQKDVGGWPELKSLPAPADSDHDGMPDEWETQHQLDPHNPEDRNKNNTAPPYTNLEAYHERINSFRIHCQTLTYS